jgi:tetratricopeptide repeat protein 30
MIILKDSVFQEILEFLDNCELYGRQIPSVVDPLTPGNKSNYEMSLDDISNSVSSEARYLKSLFLKLYEL